MTQNPIAQRITALMNARNINLRTLAREIDVEYGAIYSVFNKSRPSAKLNADIASKVAYYFGVPIEHILRGEPYNQAETPKEKLIEAINVLDEAEKEEALKYLDYLISSRKS